MTDTELIHGESTMNNANGGGTGGRAHLYTPGQVGVAGAQSRPIHVYGRRQMADERQQFLSG